MLTALEDREESEPAVHVEQQIYDGFTGPEDQDLMAAFHETERPNCAALLGGFADQRLQALGKRLLYTEAPKVMSAEGLDELPGRSGPVPPGRRRHGALAHAAGGNTGDERIPG